VSAPVFVAGDRGVVQAPADHAVTVLDTATGTRLWRESLPGPVQSVHSLGDDRMLIHYRGGLAFTARDGIERLHPVPAAADGARQKLQHLVRTGDGTVAAVIDEGDRSAPALVVTGDTPQLVDAPLRIPITVAHAQAVLAD